MSRLGRALRALALAAMAGAALTAASTGCGVAVGPAYSTAGYYDPYGYPPDAYIATTEPFYYEGHAAYWYGGYWYYRDGGRWNHYHSEPRGLYQRRMQGPPGRRGYEGGGHGHPSGRHGGGHR